MNNIHIKIKSEDGSELIFKVNPKIQFKKIFSKYVIKNGLPDIDKIRFLYDGDIINKEHTILQLGLEDGDEIDARIEQLGGFANN